MAGTGAIVVMVAVFVVAFGVPTVDVDNVGVFVVAVGQNGGEAYLSTNIICFSPPQVRWNSDAM